MNKVTVKGIVMAGGRGTRFRPLTNYLQKCMIPIGDQEKPILEYIIKLYRHHNIHDLVLLVGYRYLQIENYFNHGERFGVEIDYIQDHPEWKGSANAILNAYREGSFSKEDTLVVYYGDILSNINLTKLLEQHKNTEAKISVALSTGFNVSVGTAEVSGDWIRKFREKPRLETPVSIGILVLDGSVIDDMELFQSEMKLQTYDLMGDVVEQKVNDGEMVAAYLTDAFWYDVGSIERYVRLSNKRINDELGFLL